MQLEEGNGQKYSLGKCLQVARGLASSGMKQPGLSSGNMGRGKPLKASGECEKLQKRKRHGMSRGDTLEKMQRGGKTPPGRELAIQNCKGLLSPLQEATLKGKSKHTKMNSRQWVGKVEFKGRTRVSAPPTFALHLAADCLSSVSICQALCQNFSPTDDNPQREAIRKPRCIQIQLEKK